MSSRGEQNYRLQRNRALVPIAIFALQLRAQVLITAFFRRYPRAAGPGWVVTQMLRVTTGEIRHPVAFVVLMVINDSLFH